MIPRMILRVLQQIRQLVHQIFHNQYNPCSLMEHFPTPSIGNWRIFTHLIPKIGPYLCFASEGFQRRPERKLFPVDVASSSTAAISSANKSFKGLFLDTEKPSPTKIDIGKCKQMFSRAQVRKLLPIKFNVEIKKNTFCWFMMQINNMTSIYSQHCTVIA